MRPRVIGVGGVFFTPLYSTSDLIAHIGEWNVIWRLIVIPLLVFYAVLLNFLPYSWREPSAYKPWIKGYAIMFCLIGVFILSWLITQNTLFQISHNLCSLIFAAYFTRIELLERLLPVNLPKVVNDNTVSPSDRNKDLWQRICQMMDVEEVWRNPNLTVDSFCAELGVNRIYVARCIREHVDMTFNDYLNFKRIDYMAFLLRTNPTRNQKETLFASGFRCRHTAYRNFIKFKGCTPTEYISSFSEKAALQ